MGIKTFAGCALLCLGLAAQAQAATAISSGVLQFTGSIVEPSCRGVVAATTVRVEDCPSRAQRSHVEVRSVDRQGVPVLAVRADGQGADDGLYPLRDSNGNALTQGNYVVILSAP
jgi:type 1 fimbria pilin